jgi:hypothetical protein
MFSKQVKLIQKAAVCKTDMYLKQPLIKKRLIP